MAAAYPTIANPVANAAVTSIPIIPIPANLRATSLALRRRVVETMHATNAVTDAELGDVILHEVSVNAGADADAAAPPPPPAWAVALLNNQATMQAALDNLQATAPPPPQASIRVALGNLQADVTNHQAAASPPLPPLADGAITKTAAGICEAALTTKATKKRLCGFISPLVDHYNSCKTMENGKKLNCAFCGKPTYQFCSLCGVAVHKFVDKDSRQTPCFFLWHDTGCFGLAKADWKITNKKMKEWTYPTMAQIKANRQQMKRLNDQVIINGSNRNSQRSTATVTTNSSNSDSYSD
jgi:hypothetical protein